MVIQMKSISLNNFLPKECYPIEGEITIYERTINDKIYLIAPCVIEYNDYISAYNDSLIVVNGKAKSLRNKKSIQSSDKTYSYIINARINNYDEFNRILVNGEKCYLDIDITNLKMIHGQIVPLIGGDYNNHPLYCTVYLFSTNPDPLIEIACEK